MQLAEAQEDRRVRGAVTADAQIDVMLDAIGLSESACVSFSAANVGPAARKKLKGIVDSLRKDPHPFTKCMKNLRKEQPSWSEERRKKTCATLKQLTGRGNGSATKASLSSDVCLQVDDDVAVLLEHVDETKLAEFLADPQEEAAAT